MMFKVLFHCLGPGRGSVRVAEMLVWVAKLSEPSMSNGYRHSRTF
jgi:hypothetical protein